jgi:acetyl esterase
MKISLLASLGLLSAAAHAAALQDVGKLEVVEDDFVYAQASDVELRAHSYRPKGSAVVPAIVDIHGGAWSSGDRMQGQLYDKALASAGLYVLAIDFRQAPAFQHPAANRDVAAAVRYLRTHAQRLNIDARQIGLVGSSSGGHLALLAAVQPNDEQFLGTAIATADGKFTTPSGIDASVAYVIALWPVSDPAHRYEYAQRSGRNDLIKSHDAYYGTRERMQSASVPHALRSGRTRHNPPALIVQPGNDANIPRPMTFDLIAAYQDAGGRVEYLFYPGQPHAFGHRPSDDSTDLMRAMRDFIQRRLQSR